MNQKTWVLKVSSALGGTKITLLATCLKTWENKDTLRGRRYRSRATVRCRDLGCVWIWICASTFWQCRCWGLCGGKGYGVKLAAAVQRCCLKVMCLVDARGGIFFQAIRILCPRGKAQSFCYAWKAGLKNNNFEMSSNTSRTQRVKDGFLFDFHYLNSLPLERGPFPSINNWHLITYLPPRSGALKWAMLFYQRTATYWSAGR